MKGKKAIEKKEKLLQQNDLEEYIRLMLSLGEL